MASCTVTFNNVDGTSYTESFSVHNNISEQDFKRIVQAIFMDLSYVSPAKMITSKDVTPAKETAYKPAEESKPSVEAKSSSSK